MLIFDATLKTSDSHPLAWSLGMDLTGKLVFFSLKRRSDAQVIVDEKPCRVVDGPAGAVAYPWATGETDAPGIYFGEFTVVDQGLVDTNPPNGTLLIQIQPRLGGDPSALQSLALWPLGGLSVRVGQALPSALKAYLTVGTSPPVEVNDQVAFTGPVAPPLFTVDGVGTVAGLVAGVGTVTATLGSLVAALPITVTP